MVVTRAVVAGGGVVVVILVVVLSGDVVVVGAVDVRAGRNVGVVPRYSNLNSQTKGCGSVRNRKSSQRRSSQRPPFFMSMPTQSSMLPNLPGWPSSQYENVTGDPSSHVKVPSLLTSLSPIHTIPSYLNSRAMTSYRKRCTPASLMITSCPPWARHVDCASLNVRLSARWS